MTKRIQIFLTAVVTSAAVEIVVGPTSAISTLIR